MPWKETCAMKERILMIEDYHNGEDSVAALCRRYGVSRPTFYKWLRVFKQEGHEALGDRSRAARSHPNATPQAIQQRVLDTRLAHRTWGPRKLLAYLSRRDPQTAWPSPSTIGELLKREGLIEKRRRKRYTPPYTQPFVGCKAPNETWTADFKGWFRTRDGRRCEPLTISDAHSRYLLCCQAMKSSGSPWARPMFEATFREYGLPRAIRTDNGAPFASRAVGGLSRLAVWWIKLGIVPERIEPGHPEQNGRHERMHRTLKEETACPPKSNRRAQQRTFDQFRHEFNHERPHEALGQEPPATVYHSSPRPYPRRLGPVRYPEPMQARKVQSRGEITWRGRSLFISEILYGEHVGLAQIDERRWDVYFAHMKLGTFEDGDPLRLMPNESQQGRSRRRS